MWETELSRIAIEPVSNGFVVTHTYYLIEGKEKEYREAKLIFEDQEKLLGWIGTQIRK